jgi:gluconolactonase
VGEQFKKIARLIRGLVAAAAVCAPVVAVAQAQPSPDDQYQRGPDSLPQAGVPKGKVFEFTFDQSKIFPGTTRKITVYIPAQYNADKPACVYVGLDALGFAAPVVFDNLIAKHEMPVTIGIGIAPGTVNSDDPPRNPRNNRSFEFDGLNDNLARFVLEEVFPEVERRKAPDGLPIRLSSDPNDRAAGGASTGGIAAFSLAWERPNEFRRVFTAVGTFVGMRGGDRYAVLVRKTEPKPIRIFMQDGSNDELAPLGEVGSWWMSNQTMERALKFAGYQIEHVWGEGIHSGTHGAVVFPDAMRWLWKDWPQPITAGQSQNMFLRAILQPDEGWHVVSGDYRSGGALTANPKGEIVFRDANGAKSWRLTDDGTLSEFRLGAKPVAGIAFGPDGRAFVSEAPLAGIGPRTALNAKIVAYAPDGTASTIASGIRGLNLTVTNKGLIYVTEPGTGDSAGNVWLIKSNGEKVLVDGGLNHPSGVVLSPDGLWLAVSENKTHWGYSYRVEPNGSLQDKQAFYWFHVPDTAEASGAGPWVTDREGRLYAATRMGIQVFDRNGRSRLILPIPGGAALGVSFGGADFDTLYVSSTDHRIYRRRVKVRGAPAWAAPFELPPADPG